MIDKDYQNFDYLDIIVKKVSENEIENAYLSFLWEKTDKKEDKRYIDVVHLSFRRPHKIKNKDRLQLLQVYYEYALNSRAQLSIKKHSKSKGDIVRTIFFSAILLLGVGVFIYLTKTFFSLIFSLIFASLVFGFLIFSAGKIRKKHIKENKVYLEKVKEIDDEINGILTEVCSLTKKSSFIGGENEKV